MGTKPDPGQWVLIAAKVLDDPHPTSEEVVVELFSKTDQYAARVRLKQITDVVARPLPDEPGESAVVLVDGLAYQRLTDRWYRPGRREAHSWREVCDLGEPALISEP